MKSSFFIAHSEISPSSQTFIIAEAGVSHNGNFNLAKKLIDAAADAGANAVKFQTFTGPDLATERAEMASYQKKNLGVVMKQQDMLRSLALPKKFYPHLIRHAQKRDVIFLSTPHGGFSSVDFLDKLGVPAYKISSGDLTNLPLFAYVAKKKKPIILSTGMAVTKEINEAVNIITKQGNEKIALLHCVTNYPCPEDEVNLSAMVRMMVDFSYPVGFSDHTMGTDIAVYATLLKARIIEKHLTISRKLPGPDQVNSLEPEEFKQMVQLIRAVDSYSETERKKRSQKIPNKILGKARKSPNKTEKQVAREVRKSLVWAKNLPKRHVLAERDIEIKRPTGGLAAKKYWFFLGKVLTKSVQKDQFVKSDEVKKV